jgi:hypothetical protein
MTRQTHTIHDENVDIIRRSLANLTLIVAVVGLAVVLCLVSIVAALR